MKFIFDVSFSSWAGKSANPNIRQYQSDRNNNKIYLLLGNSIKNGWNNLYFQPKFIKVTSNPNTCLMSISRRSPINLSTTTFPNINLTQAKGNLLLA